MKYGSSARLFTVALGLVAGCASYGMPVQHLADAEASIRSARDSYAVAPPPAQLHLKLAEEELAQARRFMNDGDQQRADYTLLRSKADAELAVAEERKAKTEADWQQAAGALTQATPKPGEATDITITTGATIPAAPAPAPAAIPPLPAPVPAPAPPANDGNGGPR